jgi:hypothetical protein
VEIAVHEERIHQVVPRPEPTALMREDNDLLHAFGPAGLASLVQALIIIIASAFNDIKSVHVLLLLRLVRLVKRGNQEVHFVPHFFDVIS